ncbi:hypothetical protein GCM10027563_42440 [Parasphingorhabdus pacifica]
MHAGVDDQPDIATATTVTPVRTAERLELLPVHRGATIAPITRGDVDGHTVNEPRHLCLQEEAGWELANRTGRRCPGGGGTPVLVGSSHERTSAARERS